MSAFIFRQLQNEWISSIQRERAHVSTYPWSWIGSLPCRQLLLVCRVWNSFLVIIRLCRVLQLLLIFPHFYSTVVRFFSFDKSRRFHFFLSLCRLMFFFSSFFFCSFVSEFYFVRWNVAIFSIFCGIFSLFARRSLAVSTGCRCSCQSLYWWL